MYPPAAGDLLGNGTLDLVGSNNQAQPVTLLGNGDGTFTAARARSITSALFIK